MKKPLLFLLMLLLALGSIPFSAAAGEQTVVYVADGTNGDGSAPDKPCNNLVAAMDKLDLTADCTVVFVGKYTQKANFDYGGTWKKVTFTSCYDGVDYGADKGAKFVADGYRTVMKGELVFDHLLFEMTAASYLLVCQNHPLTLTESFEMDCKNAGTVGRLFGSSFGIVMGYQNGSGTNPPVSYSENNKIEIYSGKNILIACGNRQVTVSGNAGKEEVILGGDVEIGNLYLCSVNAEKIKNGDIEVTVKDNAHVKMINGPVDADTTINSVTLHWLGGEIDAAAIVNAAIVNESTKDKVLATIPGGSKLYYEAEVAEKESFAAVAQVFDATEEIVEPPVTTEAPHTTEDTASVKPPERLPTFGRATVPVAAGSVLLMAVAAVAVILRCAKKEK